MQHFLIFCWMKKKLLSGSDGTWLKPGTWLESLNQVLDLSCMKQVANSSQLEVTVVQHEPLDITQLCAARTTKFGPSEMFLQFSISRMQKSMMVWSSCDCSRIPQRRSITSKHRQRWQSSFSQCSSLHRMPKNYWHINITGIHIQHSFWYRVYFLVQNVNSIDTYAIGLCYNPIHSYN